MSINGSFVKKKSISTLAKFETRSRERERARWKLLVSRKPRERFARANRTRISEEHNGGYEARM